TERASADARRQRQSVARGSKFKRPNRRQRRRIVAARPCNAIVSHARKSGHPRVKGKHKRLRRC
ncbi:MAG TPA: hypothetical protein VGH40_20520, partial [Roseiarcus sp.]